MKEIQLSDRDFQEIKRLALDQWRDNHITYKNAEEFNCHCYVTAFTSYTNSKGWTLIDGKIYDAKGNSK